MGHVYLLFQVRAVSLAHTPADDAIEFPSEEEVVLRVTSLIRERWETLRGVEEPAERKLRLEAWPNPYDVLIHERCLRALPPDFATRVFRAFEEAIRPWLAHQVVHQADWLPAALGYSLGDFVDILLHDLFLTAGKFYRPDYSLVKPTPEPPEAVSLTTFTKGVFRSLVAKATDRRTNPWNAGREMKDADSAAARRWAMLYHAVSLEEMTEEHPIPSPALRLEATPEERLLRWDEIKELMEELAHGPFPLTARDVILVMRHYLDDERIQKLLEGTPWAREAPAILAELPQEVVHQHFLGALRRVRKALHHLSS